MKRSAAATGSAWGLPFERPLSFVGEAQLARRLSEALERRDGLSGSHVIHEMWMRGCMGVHIEAAIERLWKAAPETIPDWLPMTFVEWLPLVYEVTARFSARGRGRCNIYLVLLDYRDRPDPAFGLYVGMSRYSPSQRFDQHKAGIRASRAVLKRGVEVLTGPAMHLQHIARAEAADIEVRLGEALGATGVLVKGGH